MVLRIGTYLLVVVLVMMFYAPVLTAQELNREIVINIPEFTLYLYENGVVIRQYPIGIGNVLNPSVLGKTEVINLVENPTYYPIRWWERELEPIPPGPDNPVGTRWIGLGFPSYGIHGTNNPDSIGKAMSAGCIRMYNHDVEELMRLIKIGTPVNLIYQTVILTQDPLLHTKMITVYPDIYHNDSNTLEAVEQLLQQRGWTDVFLPAVQEILKHPTGQPQPLPLLVDGDLFGLPDVQAVKYGNKYYVPLEKLPIVVSAEQFRDRKQWDGVYVNAAELANKLGYGYRIDQSLEMFSVTLIAVDQPLKVKGFLQGDDLYLPVQALSQELKLPVPAKLYEYVETINGVDYLNHALSYIWGFSVSWEYPQHQAVMQFPLVWLDNQLLGIGVVINDETYVPFNAVVDLIDAEVEYVNDSILLFYKTHGVEVLRAQDVVYVPEWVIRWLMPGAELKIHQ